MTTDRLKSTRPGRKTSPLGTTYSAPRAGIGIIATAPGADSIWKNERRRAARCGRTAHVGQKKGAGVILLAHRYGQNDREIAITRNNFLFLESAEGRARRHSLCAALGSAKLKDLDQQAWLADVIDLLA